MSRLTNMAPCATGVYVPDCSLAYAKKGGYLTLAHSACQKIAYFPNLGFRKSGAADPLSNGRFKKPIGNGVRIIPGGRNPLQIARDIIAGVAIDVVDVKIAFRRSVEGIRYNTMHHLGALIAVGGKNHRFVALRVHKLFYRATPDALSERPHLPGGARAASIDPIKRPHIAMVADFVNSLIAGNWLPSLCHKEDILCQDEP